MLKPPFPYYGGKRKLTKYILEHFPPHKTYVDLFGGSGAVLLAKEPSPIEIFNDIFDGVTNFYEVLRDKDKTAELIRLLRLTPYSHTEYYNNLRTWQMCPDQVEKARRWFFVQATSFNGRFGAGLRFSHSKTSHGKAANISALHSSIENLNVVANRFRNVIIQCADFRKVIKRCDTPDTLFYADPPYVIDNRNPDSTYTYETSLADHRDLVELALNSRGMWVISGYEHEVYAPLEDAGWSRTEVAVIASAASYNAKRTKARIEVIWASPTALNNEVSGHKVGTNA
jgi:DNA adenine methylase